MRPFVLLALCALALAGVVYLISDDAPARAVPELEHPPSADASDAPSPATPLERAPDDVRVETAELDGGGLARERQLGAPIPADPTQMLAVRGTVRDAQTAKPVAGIALSLLSPRPRTVAALSDVDGRFQTAHELAPGVVSVVHVPDARDPRYAARWRIEPDRFVLPPADAGAVSPAPREIVFTAREPERVVDALIRLPDGRPAAGAAVALARGERDERGRFTTGSRAFETADERGRVRFPLFGADAFAASVEIAAELGGLTSDVLALDPPLTLAPVQIDLFPGATLAVRTRNDLARPVAGASVWIGVREADGSERGRAADTDGRGEVVFGGLRSACYEVRVVHPLTGERIVREVDLARGAHESIDVGLSLAHVRFAAGGTVVDELGYPLTGIAVEVAAPGERPIQLESGPGGRFEFWTRPCARVALAVGSGLSDDEFEPSEIVLPFGTDGVRLRRVRTFERQSRAVVLVDAASGATVERANCALFTPGGAGAQGAEPSPRALSITSLRGGAAQLDLVLRPGVRYAVDAVGYLRAEGELAELIESHGKGRVLEIALEPGFARSVTVRNRVSRRAIAGATFFEGARAFGATDEGGALLLRAPTWPTALRVEASGYGAQTWDPAVAGFPGDVVWLEPL